MTLCTARLSCSFWWRRIGEGLAEVRLFLMSGWRFAEPVRLLSLIGVTSGYRATDQECRKGPRKTVPLIGPASGVDIRDGALFDSLVSMVDSVCVGCSCFFAKVADCFRGTDRSPISGKALSFFIIISPYGFLIDDCALTLWLLLSLFLLGINKMGSCPRAPPGQS